MPRYKSRKQREGDTNTTRKPKPNPWATMEPPQKRAVMLNPRQVTPRPTWKNRTFTPVRPKLSPAGKVLLGPILTRAIEGKKRK